VQEQAKKYFLEDKKNYSHLNILLKKFIKDCVKQDKNFLLKKEIFLKTLFSKLHNQQNIYLALES
jgi:hypothetical protein